MWGWKFLGFVSFGLLLFFFCCFVVSSIKILCSQCLFCSYSGFPDRLPLKNVCSFQIQNICEKGLQVGHSKMSILGRPSMGKYPLILCAGIIQYELAGYVMQLCKCSVFFVFSIAGTSQLGIFSKVC